MDLYGILSYPSIQIDLIAEHYIFLYFTSSEMQKGMTCLLVDMDFPWVGNKEFLLPLTGSFWVASWFVPVVTSNTTAGLQYAKQ